MHQQSEETLAGREPSAADHGAGELLDSKRHAADDCIKNYVLLSMATGLLPSAVVNVVAVTALEVKMIGSLARVYGFPVPNKLLRYELLISLIGSLGSVYVAIKSRQAFKGVPVIGHAIYVGMMSIAGGAAMYAVGKMFQEHFETGGTFLGKDSSVLRAYFKKKYEEGRKVVPQFARERGAAVFS